MLSFQAAVLFFMSQLKTTDIYSMIINKNSRNSL